MIKRFILFSILSLSIIGFAASYEQTVVEIGKDYTYIQISFSDVSGPKFKNIIDKQEFNKKKDSDSSIRQF